MDFPKLFTVGPVYVRDEVREEMSRQMFSHRSSNYKELHAEVVPKLQKLMFTEKLVIPTAFSATGIWEACARNCVEKKTVSCVNGSFSKRFADVIEANGKETVRVEKDAGQAVLPEELDTALKNNPDADSVSIVYNETSTGVMEPLEEMLKVCKDHDKLSMVDVVSAVSGAPLYVDKWDIDVCLFSVQKCLAVPPGLGVFSVSERALERSAKAVNKGYFFDMKVLEKYALKDQTPSTPPIPQIFALNKALDFIIDEGIEAVWQRHKEVSDYVKERCLDMGFELFPDPDYASQTISAISTKSKGINAKDLLAKMKEKQYVVGSGYGSFKEETFRVGNMGNVYKEDAEEMLDVMEEVLKGF
jgi:aspartate aminotransferase-like enzyme